MVRLDEVKRLQKIAGILKENVDEARRGAGRSIDAAVMKAFPEARKSDIRNLENQPDYEDLGDTVEAYYILPDEEQIIVVTTQEGELMYIHLDANGDRIADDGGLLGDYESYTGAIVNGKLGPIDFDAEVPKPKGEVNIIDVIKSKFPQFPIDDYEVFTSEYEISAGEFDSEIGLDNIRALNSAADKGYIKAFDDVVKINSMFYSKEQQEKYRAKYK